MKAVNRLPSDADQDRPQKRQHSKGAKKIKVKANLKAGKLAANHNQTVAR